MQDTNGTIVRFGFDPVPAGSDSVTGDLAARTRVGTGSDPRGVHTGKLCSPHAAERPHPCRLCHHPTACLGRRAPHKMPSPAGPPRIPSRWERGWDDLFCAGNQTKLLWLSLYPSTNKRPFARGCTGPAGAGCGSAAPSLGAAQGRGTSSCPLSPRTRSLQDLSCPSPRRQT